MERRAFHLAALAALVAGCLVTAPVANAKGGGHGSGHSGGSHAPHSSASHASGHTAHSSSRDHASSPAASNGRHNKNYAQGVARDSNGKIARSEKAKNEFKKSHPCPSTGNSGGGCPGYVIDHKHALKHGGKDKPSNMQWQTKQAAKAKDKWE